MIKHWILVGQTPIEVDLIEWANWFEHNDRTVARSRVSAHGRSYDVSTVFLGLDHSFSLGQAELPELFETMVFTDDEDDPWTDYQCRWRSYLEAKRGHLVIEIQVGSNRKP